MTESVVDLIGVVIPVHNEALHLEGCLQAVTAAWHHLRRDPRAPQVRVVVVLDRCTDGSAAIAARFPHVQSVAAEAATVGRARSIGAEHVLGDRPDRVWLACTDADSVVPTRWLAHQWSAARSGVELLLGTVRPAVRRPGDGPPSAGPDRLGRLERLDPVHYARWAAGYVSRFGHPHVHGANLGIRGDAYRECGGFPPLPAHEDVALAEAVRARGLRVVSSAAHPVDTSARTEGRAPSGFAAFLAGTCLDPGTSSVVTDSVAS